MRQIRKMVTVQVRYGTEQVKLRCSTVPVPDVPFLAQLSDEWGEMGSQIISNDDLDVSLWEPANVVQEQLRY